ncbi:MAG: hypothetical protein IJV48_01505 [Ruminococcus sp.]|nr:hypothetical protein [Ruminococcus sp.]
MKSSIKSIIITVSVVFLAIIALLTYFSGTIDNYLLPHVKITYGGEGTLKYSLYDMSVLEQPSADSTHQDSLRFRFNCDKSLDVFVQMGSVVDCRASVQTAENEYVMRDGSAVIVGKRETENGIECTAELKDMELKGNESMPTYGDEIIIDSVFETQRYGHIVMKSAIQNGSYVYVVIKDDADKRYVAEVPVTILAESDFYAAVDMDSDMLPIVLTCSKEIHDGQRVIVDD